MRHQSPHPTHRPERNHQIPVLPPMIVLLLIQIEVVSERTAVGVLYELLPVAVQSPASPEFRLAVRVGMPISVAPSSQNLVPESQPTVNQRVPYKQLDNTVVNPEPKSDRIIA